MNDFAIEVFGLRSLALLPNQRPGLGTGRDRRDSGTLTSRTLKRAPARAAPRPVSLTYSSLPKNNCRPHAQYFSSVGFVSDSLFQEG